ncbi:RNA polymerase sigma factor [Pelagicoccus sp. NFK12]|uniref:RNA polymerase sigma factor n=1 Tax=Pelagicoccus enzymogenes TaxID=2773457 RepID=A0A927F7V9_9BACT|nr:RNA polymerase sigma factor [Pelagicoccus enzymogenes]MBD5780068.1 RNA polymerase sigma factor [Pelagicoccus enzymogenes]MDQ8198636.1 RNA polymerase sigma factor [Pelagicoccus enzymogenes]
MALSDQNDWFEEEIEPHEPSLRAWLRSRFGFDSAIDDIVQESYIRILKYKGRTEVTSPKAYLFRTAHNVAVDYLKDLKKRQAEPLDEGSNIVHLEDWDNAKDILQHRNEVELLRSAIDSLPERCREIFVMRRVHGLASAEIAARLKISTHTVSSQLTIGLKKCTEYVQRATGNKLELR